MRNTSLALQQIASRSVSRVLLSYSFRWSFYWWTDRTDCLSSQQLSHVVVQQTQRDRPPAGEHRAPLRRSDKFVGPGFNRGLGFTTNVKLCRSGILFAVKKPSLPADSRSESCDHRSKTGGWDRPRITCTPSARKNNPGIQKK